MADVVRANEVLLYGYRFPIAGGVAHTVVTPFAPKFTQGDYTRDDKIVDSTWVLSSWSGGLGTLYHDFPRDQDSYWFGDLEGRYRHLTLGPEVHTFDDTLSVCDTLVDYNERLYVVDASSEAFLIDASAGSKSSIGTLDGPVTSTFEWGDELWFVTETSLYAYDPVGDTLTTYDGGVSGYFPGGYAAVVWDSKVFILGTDNVLRWSITPDDQSDSWTDKAQLQMPTGYCRQLLVFFDQLGEPQIHAITRRGVYGYDFDADTWYQTPLVFPTTQGAEKGATTWRGELKVQAGEPIYSYNGSVIRNESLSGQDGLPAAYRGNVSKVIPGHAFYYAIMESTVAGESNITDPFYTTSPLDQDPMTANETSGALFVSTGSSWHPLYLPTAGVEFGDSVVASIQDTFRIWFSTTDGLQYIELSRDLHNPLQNPASTFKPSGYIETGWADMGWAELDKLGLKLDVETRQVDEDNTISFYVAWDEDDTWEHIATVTQSGSMSYTLAGQKGRVFKTMRVRIEMNRDESDPSTTPVLQSAVITFHRVPEQLFGWQFDLQLTEPYNKRTPHQLQEEFKAILKRKQAGLFTYLTDYGEQESHWIRISRVQGQEQAGRTRRGRESVSVIEVGE